MKGEFDNWLKFIMELHEACAEEESHTGKLFRDAKSKEDAKKFLEAAHALSLNEQKERVKKMEVKVEEHNERYKKLLDSFPTGYVHPSRLRNTLESCWGLTILSVMT